MMWKTIETKSADDACAIPQRRFLPLRTIYIALLFLCLFPYRGILDNRLFNDDYSWLRAARLEMAPHNLLTYRVVDFFRPLVNASFWAMERMAPGNIPLHYGFTIILHALCTILVFHFLSKLLGGARVAFAGAALFAITSVHAAAVLWISARTTLLSTAFLLASLTVLLQDRRPGPWRIVAAGFLYVLALASKEEAIAGLPLAFLLFVITRRPAARLRLGGGALTAVFAISLAYLFVRLACMGGFASGNWGSGAHPLRNIAGGFLYQLYPWPLFSLLYPRFTAIAEPSAAVMPELLVVPLIGLLILLGRAGRVSFAMNFAVAWALLALTPVAPFRYRFFSTDSISQSRYYYLSSVGTCLVIVLILSMLWRERSRGRRMLAAAIFVFLAAGYIVRDHRLEMKWDEYTRYNEGIVDAIIEESDIYPDVKRIAIENPPMALRYLEDAIILERPDRSIVAAADSIDAARHAPCVHISYSGKSPTVMRIRKIEGPP